MKIVEDYYWFRMKYSVIVFSEKEKISLTLFFWAELNENRTFRLFDRVSLTSIVIFYVAIFLGFWICRKNNFVKNCILQRNIRTSMSYIKLFFLMKNFDQGTLQINSNKKVLLLMAAITNFKNKNCKYRIKHLLSRLPMTDIYVK